MFSKISIPPFTKQATISVNCFYKTFAARSGKLQNVPTREVNTQIKPESFKVSLLPDHVSRRGIS